MSITPDAKEDRPAAVASPVRPTANWRVDSVEPLPDYRLKVRFVDGTEGVVEMRRLISSPHAGVFEALRDPIVFARAHVFLGAVTWPGELDLSPDAMYDGIKACGVWEPV